MQKLFDFQKQLAWSEAQHDAPFWDAFYRQMFPALVSHMPCPGNTDSQRMGIDRVVALANGRVLRIDEKKVRADFPNFFLEYISVDTTNAPGWIEKPLFIDYLAYAFMPSRTVYLFDFLILQRAWQQNKANWMKRFRTHRTPNKQYHTVGLLVPRTEVLKAVNDARRVVVQIPAQQKKAV